MAEAAAPIERRNGAPPLPAALSEDNRHNIYPDPNKPLDPGDPHGLGETPEQHAAHASIATRKLWGMDRRQENYLFYVWMISSLCLLIAAAVIGRYYRTWHPAFIGVMTAFMVTHWAGWLQTAVGMAQRASWVREEADLETRKQYLYLAVRLNRLMLPTAIIGLSTFIPGYVDRDDTPHDLPYWLLFLLIFIWNAVFSVMNAYNNITWESDRLEFEGGEQPFRITKLAILGLPSPKEKFSSGKQREGKEI
ncbi:hypothetical protein LTR62_002405 [Meristemomyces frigidus]|uniref:Uncharacterized protein n=1 Tax=Meristemomyces frigidus TaxID=1508187 RepID=A0AAN7TFQ1_9PEZI|nr:hypothetical protein LTR62_002405 [Meristemomyces frigidus]